MHEPASRVCCAGANPEVVEAEKRGKYSANGTTTRSVNFPDVALAAHAGKHPLLHVRRNQSGA